MDPLALAHRPSKRLGQNFLVDLGIAKAVVACISPHHSDTVLEPGPGRGTLTQFLIEKVGNVIAIEKDPRLVSELRIKFRDRPNIAIIPGDVLKMRGSMPSFNKVVSTPPYYISSKLMLLLADKKFDVAALVLQKEFGHRLIAKPGSSEYGRLTVSVSRKLDIELLQNIPRTAFAPRPKVDSSLLRFVPKTLRTELDERLLEEMVRGMFTQRKRLSKGALLHFLSLQYGRNKAREIIERISIPDARVYQLSVSQFEDLSLQLWRVLSSRLSFGQEPPIPDGNDISS